MARSRRASKSSVVVRDARASFVWTLAIPELFGADFPKGMAALASGPAYQAVFAKPEDGPVGVPKAVVFPWPRATGQNFWLRYLERASLAALPKLVAWSRLVPLRKRLGTAWTVDSPHRSVVFEVFFYPHGLGLVASTRIDDPLDPESLVDRLTEIKVGQNFTIEHEEGTITGRLGDIATQLLGQVAAHELGIRGPSGDATVDPYSTVTIIAADGDFAAAAAPPSDDVMRALYGLSSWSPTWRVDPLPDREGSIITRSSKPQGHIVFARDRGRVVWFPQLFGQSSRPRHTLSCYHRNQTLLALTAESMAGALRTTKARLDTTEWLKLSKNERICATHAGECLSRLYRGEGTYRSRAVIAQLDANGGKTAFDGLAKTLGVPAIPA